MAIGLPAQPAQTPARDTPRGMAWGEKLHSPALQFAPPWHRRIGERAGELESSRARGQRQIVPR